MRVTVCRKAHFNAAHRLFVKSWDDQKNETVFGKCSNPHYHGHNYELIVNVTGTIDPVTGYVMDMKELKDLIKAEVEDAFDHKNLNLECPEFENVLPSTEHFAKIIYDLLKVHLDAGQQLHITLLETAKNSAEYGDW